MPPTDLRTKQIKIIQAIVSAGGGPVNLGEDNLSYEYRLILDDMREVGLVRCTVVRHPNNEICRFERVVIAQDGLDLLDSSRSPYWRVRVFCRKEWKWIITTFAAILLSSALTQRCARQEKKEEKPAANNSTAPAKLSAPQTPTPAAPISFRVEMPLASPASPATPQKP
jgi:hypothetical protein